MLASAEGPLRGRRGVLQIGNYPPPMCGWAIQTKLVTDELRRRGHVCEVLKINENRRVKDPAYIDVQNGRDYLYKVFWHACKGYRLNVHVNGQSKPGYLLALAAALVGRLVWNRAFVTFHGGLSQQYFPKDSGLARRAFQLLFHLAGGIACDSDVVKRAIESYGITQQKVTAIETFSTQYLSFERTTLGGQIEQFLQTHEPTFFSYVSFRPEYRLEILREAMARFRDEYPQAGIIWLGFPDKEVRRAEEFVAVWSSVERASLLLLGNLDHNRFLTLLGRCDAYIRTPACDGVSASVLESLALGIPVIASENGSRPAGVVTYQELDVADLCSKMKYVIHHQMEIRSTLSGQTGQDNVGRMADWLTGETGVSPAGGVVHVA